MIKTQNYSPVSCAIITVCLIIMGANCPDCSMSKNCSANNNKRELCKKDKRCYFNNATNICHQRPEGLLSGCFDIDDEIPCKESKDCTYDPVAKVCLDATPKGLCANIQVAVACDADANCVWDHEATPPSCKDKTPAKTGD